jgi:hypothetical protein
MRPDFIRQTEVAPIAIAIVAINGLLVQVHQFSNLLDSGVILEVMEDLADN